MVSDVPAKLKYSVKMTTEVIMNYTLKNFYKKAKKCKILCKMISIQNG